MTIPVEFILVLFFSDCFFFWLNFFRSWFFCGPQWHLWISHYFSNASQSLTLLSKKRYFACGLLRSSSAISFFATSKWNLELKTHTHNHESQAVRHSCEWERWSTEYSVESAVSNFTAQKTLQCKIFQTHTHMMCAAFACWLGHWKSIFFFTLILSLCKSRDATHSREWHKIKREKENVKIMV